MKYFSRENGEENTKMKKKIVSMLLVAAMVASMAVGCGSKNDSGSSDIKSDKGESITFMAPDWAIHLMINWMNLQKRLELRLKYLKWAG